jgi:hypothetical protein
MAGCHKDYLEERWGHPKNWRRSRRGDGGNQRQQIGFGWEKTAALRSEKAQQRIIG